MQCHVQRTEMLQCELAIVLSSRTVYYQCEEAISYAGEVVAVFHAVGWQG